MKLSPEVEKAAPEVVRLRRRIHAHPEPGFREERTAALIRERLRAWGIEHEAVCGTGTVALVRGASPGPTVLFRADMDALPVSEECQVPYRSQVPGVMHACGHDGHVAMALGAARVLAARRERLAGTVKLMFQPAEEGPGGALPMLEAGLLERPRVDAAFAIHLWNDLPVGTVGVRAGPAFASTDEFTLRVVGKGGHGAAPHQTIDPVLVAAQIVVAAQSIVARRIDPTNTAVLTFGQVHGGTRHNVIPDSVALNGTVRAVDPRVRKQLHKELEQLARGVARALGARVEVEWDHGYPPTINDPAMCELVRRAATRVVGKRRVVEQDLTMGAEDMSYVLERVPGCYLMLGSGNPQRGLIHPHHSPRFDFDEAALACGVEVWARIAEEAATALK